MNFSLDYSVYEKGKKSPEYTLDSDIAGDVSFQDFLDFMKKSLLTVADTVLREEQGKGFDKDPVIAVDNRIGKPLIQVKPFGSITFTARQDISEVSLEIYQGLLDRSPVDTGLYKKNHVVFFNGKVIATDPQELKTFFDSNPEMKDGDILRFINVVPYAGRVERRGIRSGSPNKVRRVKSRDKRQRSGPVVDAANGAYYLTARQALRKYKFNSKIYFEFYPGRALEGIGNLSQKNGKPFRRTFIEGNKKGYRGPYVYPSIRIVIQTGGIK